MPDARKKPAFGRAGEDSAQIKSHLNDSREQLQDELIDVFFQADEEALSGEKLDELLAALDEADPLPETGADDAEKSLARFHEKYAPVFSALEEKTAAAPASPPAKRPSRRALAKVISIAAAAAVLLGTVTCQALGLDVFGAIARWTAAIFQLEDPATPYATIRTVPLDEGEEAHYDTLEEAVEAFGITAPIVPQWIPERFALTDVSASNKSGGVLIYADYESEDAILQVRFNEIISTDFNSLEQQGDKVETYFSGGLKHYLLSDLDREKAFWQNGALECQITGNLSRQEVKDIIDSIYLR